jgi:hypothetical protein
MSRGPIADAALRYGWRFVLCGRDVKDPWTPEGRHEYRDLSGAAEHVRRGFNIGLTGTNVSILDWDDAEGRELLFHVLGPLPLTVQTARGKHHTYVQSDRTLPGVIRLLDGRLVGEIRRLPSEYVVCPPSTFQGGTYRCLLDRIDIEPLPETWRDHLRLQPQTSSERGEPFEVPERIDAGGNGRPGLSRHDVFFRWTRSWKAQGFTYEMTLETILLANRTITFPPLDDEHLRREVQRAWDRADRPEFEL